MRNVHPKGSMSFALKLFFFFIDIFFDILHYIYKHVYTEHENHKDNNKKDTDRDVFTKKKTQTCL